MAAPIVSHRNAHCVSKSSRQQPSSTPLQILLQMGIPKHRAEKALAATGGRSVQIAADWLLAHVNDPTLDNNTPREYILYLCPSGPLLEQLHQFFEKSLTKSGRNGSHNYLPHITLCSFFQAPDGSVPHLLHALQHVVEKLRGEIPERIQLDHYTSPTFLGLFVAEEHNDSLKRLAVQFMREVSEYSIQVEPYLKALHITLSYQFAAENYAVLESLSREIEVNSAATWELKLFSRDTRIKGNEVFRVCHPYMPQQEPDELELIVGDFIYANPELGSSSNDTPCLDGWSEGVSWLTGCIGLFMKDYVEKAAESDAWTLHKSVPLTGTVALEELDEPSLLSRRLPLNYFQHYTAEMNSTIHHKPSKDKLNTDPDSSHKSGMVETMGRGDMENPGKKTLQSVPRRLFIARHAERMDFTFGQWIPMCIDSNGKYVRKDLNMPHYIPPRNGGFQDYDDDCPLTRIGLYQATLTGEAFKESEVIISQAFCSPSLRCVQTCTNILKGCGQSHIPLHIEPGLFEWLAWYQDGKPAWLTPEETKQLGYNIVLDYKPVISLDEIKKGNETHEQYYIRSYYVTQSILKRQGGNVLFVAHAASLDTCSRQLTGQEYRSANDLVRITHKTPYCGVAVVEEKSEGKWELVDPPFPRLIHTGNSQFDWRNLLA